MGAERHINENQLEGMEHFPQVMYHGTSLENARRIKQEGFRTETPEGHHSTHGPGVYLSNYQTAKSYADNRYVHTVLDRPDFGEGAVLEVIVHPRRPISAPSGPHSSGTRFNQTYDFPDSDVWVQNDRGKYDPLMIASDPSSLTVRRILSPKQKSRQNPDNPNLDIVDPPEEIS